MSWNLTVEKRRSESQCQAVLRAPRKQSVRGDLDLDHMTLVRGRKVFRIKGFKSVYDTEKAVLFQAHLCLALDHVPLDLVQLVDAYLDTRPWHAKWVDQILALPRPSCIDLCRVDELDSKIQTLRQSHEASWNVVAGDPGVLHELTATFLRRSVFPRRVIKADSSCGFVFSTVNRIASALKSLNADVTSRYQQPEVSESHWNHVLGVFLRENMWLRDDLAFLTKHPELRHMVSDPVAFPAIGNTLDALVKHL